MCEADLKTVVDEWVRLMILLMGQYTGYRLLELSRFKALAGQ